MAFSIIANADAVAKVKAEGLKQLGTVRGFTSPSCAYGVKSIADSMAAKLKANGF
jgi:hypothetical protein